MTGPLREAATRSSWKTQPCPTQRATLNFARTYSAADFERITFGLIPLVMEDKWFIFYQEPWLYFHRSWTGFCVYGARFQSSADGMAVVEAWASRNTDEYRGTSVADDESILGRLIDGLLRRPA